jgi:hypothetical protein
VIDLSVSIRRNQDLGWIYNKANITIPLSLPLNDLTNIFQYSLITISIKAVDRLSYALSPPALQAGASTKLAYDPLPTLI